MVRAIIIGVVVGLVLMVTSYGQTPSKADLLKTVQHIQALAKEQQQELDQEKVQHAQVAQALSQATRDNTILQSRVNAITAKLNSTQDKLDKCAKNLWWWRLHSLMMKILGGVLLLLVAVFVFLWLTGRLAGAAAAVVSKVP